MPGFIDFSAASKHDPHYLDLIDIPQESYPATKFTFREQQVLSMIANKPTNPETAQTLC